MKKFLFLTLTALFSLLLISVSTAENLSIPTIDYSALTEEQLIQMVNNAQEHLASKGYIIDIQKTSEKELFVWYDCKLTNLLPTPEKHQGAHYGSFSVDSSSLDADIKYHSIEQYYAYLEKCKELGYVINSDFSSSRSGCDYLAYNENGFYLELSYRVSREQMSIELEAPIEMKTIRWPTSEIAQLLPVPPSDYGRIEWEASYGFVIYLGDFSKEQFDQYVYDCWDKGFTIDYSKGVNSFYADNENGYRVSLNYEGNNVVWIRIDGP